MKKKSSNRIRNEATTPPEKRHASRVQYLLNYKLAIGALVALVLVGGVALGLHRMQTQNIADALLKRAEVQEENGEFREAALSRERYLNLRPDDPIQEGLMLRNLAKVARTSQDFERLKSLYERVAEKYPADIQLQLELVDLCLSTLNFQQALVRAQRLYDTAALDEKERHELIRQIAVAKYSLATMGGEVDWHEISTWLMDASRHFPSDPTVVSLTANLLRDRPEVYSGQVSDAHQEADRLMDHLVDSRDRDRESLVARYRYRAEHHLEGADKDLEEAFQLAPNDFEVLTFKARQAALFLTNDEADRRVRLQKEREFESYLVRIIQINPYEIQSYVELARIHLAREDAASALEVLKKGREFAGRDDFFFHEAHVLALLAHGDLKEAQQLLNEIDESLRQILPNLPVGKRQSYERAGQLLHAKLKIAAREWTAAIGHLTAVYRSIDRTSSMADDPSVADALYLLANAMEVMQRWERAGEIWLELAAVRSNFPWTRSRAALAYLHAGRPQQAIDILESPEVRGDREQSFNAILGDPNYLAAEAHLEILKGIREGLLQPSEGDTVKAFSESHAAVVRTSRNSWMPVILLARYHQLSTEPDARETAVKGLKSSESRYAGDLDFWFAVGRMYLELDALEEAQRVVKRLESQAPSAAQTTVFRAIVLTHEGQWAEADQQLREAIATASEGYAELLTIQRIKLAATQKNYTVSIAAIKEFVDRFGAEPQILGTALAVALAADDPIVTASLEEITKPFTHIDDFPYRFLKAMRLCDGYAELSDDERRELTHLIPALETQRPQWGPILSLQARYSAVRENSREAANKYRQALALGDRTPFTLTGLMAASPAQSDPAESDLFAKLQASLEKTGEYAAAAATCDALSGDNIPRAFDAAVYHVAMNMDATTADLTRAERLMNQQDGAQAIEVLERSLEKHPADRRLWLAALKLHARTSNKAAIIAVLDRARTTTALEGVDRERILAYGAQLIGDNTAAVQHYRAAAQLAPHDTALRMESAMYLASYDPDAARAECELILQQEPQHVQAGQLLAALLSASGDSVDWARAEQLLEEYDQDSSGASTPYNYRLRAALTARQGKSQVERREQLRKAREIILEHERATQIPLTSIDRNLLVKLLEQEAHLAPTEKEQVHGMMREQLQLLTKPVSADSGSIIRHIEFLTTGIASKPAGRARESDEVKADAKEALALIQRLAAMSGTDLNQLSLSLRAIKYRVQLLLLLSQEALAEKSLVEYRKVIEPLLTDDRHRFEFHLTLAQVFEALEQLDQAEEQYRKLPSLHLSGLAAYVDFLVRAHRTTDAIQLCKSRLSDNAPFAAVLMCQILAAAPEDKNLQAESLPTIEEIMTSNPEDTELLSSAAVMYASLGQNDVAITQLEKLLKIAPNHVLAQNNLATLLAEDPQRQEDGMVVIDQAIKVAGRQPALLDTKGTLLLRSGKFQEAVACLEEATIMPPVDPRYWLHLAQAYYELGDISAADQALTRAQVSHVGETLLTSAERAEIKQLEQNLAGRKPEQSQVE